MLWAIFVRGKAKLELGAAKNLGFSHLEWPISADSQLFQSFPTEAAQNHSEWPISPNS